MILKNLKLLAILNNYLEVPIFKKPDISLLYQMDININYKVYIPDGVIAFRIIARGGHDLYYSRSITEVMSVGNVSFVNIAHNNGNKLMLTDNIRELNFYLTRKSGAFNFINIQFYR